jgi:hypothetical protein
MRRLAVIAACAAAVALAAGGGPAAAQARSSAGSAGSTSAASGGTWGTAIEVPGTAALNTGGNATVQAVSCPSAGNCTAGGYYNVGAEVFVVSEVHGTWGKAIKVPGSAALNTGGGAQINSVSCASAGNCTAGGWYTVSAGDIQAFVVNQVNGTWHQAKPVATALNLGGGGAVNSVSCASAGNCTAGGTYNAGSAAEFFQDAFVVSEVNGTWGTAKEVPGTATLNAGGNANITSVSCASAGNCSAGGWYTQSSGNQQAFVITQTGSTWGTAKEVPGTAALNQTGFAVVNSVSCTSPGNCTAGGEYNDSSDRGQAFTVTQTGGTWAKAKKVPGTGALNQGGGAGVNGAAVTSVSCRSAGNCSAGGQYKDSAGHFQVFVVTKTNGTWGTAIEVPGFAALNAGGSAAIGSAGIASVSCASAGNCSTGGNYTDNSGHGQVFVDSQTNGTWGTAEQVPGTATLNTGGFAEMSSVSCAPAGTCSAGGFYQGPGGLQAFVVNKT